MLLPLVGLGDLLDLTGDARADHRFGDRGAVDHLLERDRERLATGGGPREGLERRARGVERLRLPVLGGTIRGLEAAGAEQPRAALLRGGAGDVGAALEAYPT